jgi:NADPH:quinone reductase-like Zn-dependent oxidoreductase
VLARDGGYLFQPFPGFTPGYDFVGEILEPAQGSPLGAGTRVAACLPRMGAYTTIIDVPGSLIVPVPEGLDSAVAAALPLDLLTAGRALQLARLPEHGILLVNGVRGNIGRILAALARRDDHIVAGTASEPADAGLSAAIYNYRDAGWIDAVLRDFPGGVHAVVDHTGAGELRRLVRSGGVVVRTSFVGRRGHERADTVLGGVRTVLSPRERLVSVPVFLATARQRSRRLLSQLLGLISAGELTPPRVRVMPFADVVAAHEQLRSDVKTVLNLVA